MTFTWPDGFARIPDEPWATSPLETLALKYDSVEDHGWYENLEPTLDQLQAFLQPEHLLVDYSGGTGILIDRLLKRDPSLDTGFLIVDASPKFLRLAKEKLGDDERVAFRVIQFLKQEERLQMVDEVIGQALVERGAEAIVSTNAIHLYYGLPETLRSWIRILKPGGAAFVQSGNIGNPNSAPDEWIIDNTVDAIHQKAMEIVRTDDAHRAYRGMLADERMAPYDKLRNKFFLPARPLDYYVGALGDAGFLVDSVERRSIEADVGEWYDFLAVYHEGVLGWVGGSERIEGAAPSEEAIRDRLAIMKQAMTRLFEGADTFQACWTYITARRS